MTQSSSKIAEKWSGRPKQFWCRELLAVFRFGVVGVMATSVHILVVWILLNYTNLPTLIANAFAFLTAFGVSFSGHYFWTFQTPGGFGGAIQRFLLISTGGFAMNNLFLAAMLRIGWLSPFAAAVFSIAVIPFVTFLLSRLWGFNRAGQ